MLKGLQALALLIALLICGLLAYAYSGLYDVSAMSPDGPLLRWLAGTVRRHSIHARLDGITVPLLTDPVMVEEGFDHYHEMCEGCHLAPGIEDSELRAGLNPQPPLLYKTVPRSSPAELFWTVKNGIKMTGMPAWGVTHDDDKIWAIVAFLEQLPKMTPEQYQAMVKDASDVEMHHAAAPAVKADKH
jgi:mono/diheme cytochrome c family protein